MRKKEMCGIFAVLDPKNNRLNPETLEKMSTSIMHRGPDDCGYAFFELFGKERVIELRWNIEPKGLNQWDGLLILGHRRLSIIDLTETGHQPMCNETRRIWITYNGEIYNYIELKEELLRNGHIFKSNSDTEVIIHSYEEWGTDCLSRFNGMWAFALWDIDRKRLFCARDRFGVKPFYYFFDGKRFVLASEIKGILQDSTIGRYPNDNRIYDYLAFGYIDHTEETFFKHIYQLRGSHLLTLSIEGEKLNLDIKKYWDLERKEEDVQQPEKKFLELFEDSIRLHMRSDVPVGTCLSGGLDSSSIVCVAKKFLGFNTHKTFSSCFEDKKYDEREYIQEVIRVSGSKPYYVFPNPQNLIDEIEKVIWYQEEPFGSTSIYAQWNVFKLAKLNQVKVILDGQGGDEILAGYHHYFGPFLSDLIKRKRLIRLLQEYNKIKELHGHSNRWLIRQLIFSLIPKYLLKIVRKEILKQKERWINFPKTYSPEIESVAKFRNIFLNQLYNSLMKYSLPGLLHYEDRNSMAHSIEARVPFLDYRLAEFVFSLPIEQLIFNGSTKVILREAMHGVLPESVRTRKDKMGFVTPEDIWFRTNLKNFIKEIIHSKSFSERPYFHVEKFQEAFRNHCKGRVNISPFIWRVVNLELWFMVFIDGASTKACFGEVHS